ncbi:ferric-chelate reductase 1 [Salvelinus sp. IW2-2015]|uniref:ferric-chelate reductase 1 n=1 Tax=Salvelinus sp. IW2-2015 TaxID=2691554 RepID=UPI000CEB28FF|nr:putative ferric-chelate reductase 1 [Salvelinus alpinus]
MDNSSRMMFAVVMVMAYMVMGAKTQNSTMAPNVTMAANATTTGLNITTNLSTPHSPGVNITINGTMAPNTTMSPTAVVPVVNTTVTALTVNISRTDCGKTQLCAAEPSECNPALPGSCFFVSTQQTSGQTFSFQLRGVSSGYIAVGLSTNSTPDGNATIYVCANNNSNVMFFTALLNKRNLTINNALPVDSVKGSVKGQIIQCTFSATVPNATATRSIDTSFYLSIFNGTFMNGILGDPNFVMISNKAVDLSNSQTTVINSLNSNTNSSHAFGLQHTLSQALLILLGVVGLMML